MESETNTSSISHAGEEQSSSSVRNDPSPTPVRGIEVLRNSIPRLMQSLTEAENKLLTMLDEKEELHSGESTDAIALALEKLDTDINHIRTIMNTRKEQLELRQNLLKRLLESSKSNNNSFQNDLNSSFINPSKNKIVVPPNLPKF